jgi:hypothetical protein
VRETRCPKFVRETLKVKERRDDTTNGAAESRPARERGRYYYDDATGYEPYTPEEDEEGDECVRPKTEEDAAGEKPA